ncbi:MAG: hypothetical protein RL375_441, partial [Pseudomonadota bacterium]
MTLQRLPLSALALAAAMFVAGG